MEEIFGELFAGRLQLADKPGMVALNLLQLALTVSLLTMKAYIINKSDKIELADVDKPAANDNEVLVQVKAIGINPVDFKTLQVPFLRNVLIGDASPGILGWDMAGVVAEAGKDATKFKVGDKVFGMVNFPGHGKCYAEMVAAPQDHLALVPSNAFFTDAAATTLAALTALQALKGRVKAGDRVLIHAGSGGVGTFAIQIAKSMGCTVITTSSAKNKDYCMSLGADEHIDYREKDFSKELKDLEFVLDGMGGETLEKSLKVVKNGGKVVTLPTGDFAESIKEYAKEHDITVEFTMVQSSGKDMATLADMMASGKLKPHVSKTFPFGEMQAALDQLESGRTVGKVVVEV